VDVSPVIARLRANLTGFTVVAGSADLEAATASNATTPAAYVMPLAESAEPNDMLGLTHQRLTLEFAVVTVVANLRDATGAAATADLNGKRMQVRAALVGWVPDASNGEPVTFTSGRLLQFRDSQLWWIDDFAVRADYRSA
jgi:hypothetical protein